MKLKPILLLLILFSCSSQYTKTDYLNDYEKFIVDVRNNWQDFNDSEWKEKRAQNKEFYEDKYSNFASELKPSETVRILRYNFVFMFYSGDITISKLASGDYNEVFKGFAMELNEIYRELTLALSDFENERNSVLIDKLLE